MGNLGIHRDGEGRNYGYWRAGWNCGCPGMDPRIQTFQALVARSAGSPCFQHGSLMSRVKPLHDMIHVWKNLTAHVGSPGCQRSIRSPSMRFFGRRPQPSISRHLLAYETIPRMPMKRNKKTFRLHGAQFSNSEALILLKSCMDCLLQPGHFTLLARLEHEKVDAQGDHVLWDCGI